MKIAIESASQRNGAEAQSEGPPFPVTLVIPVRNESESILELIATICRQTRLPDQVVLVDGGSTDDTVIRILDSDWGGVDFEVITAGPASPGRGRNVGIQAATHDWIVLTDAGIKLEPDWLEYLTTAAKTNPHADVIYGSYEPQVTTLFERCAALAYVAPRHTCNGLPMRGPSTASMMICRKAWESVGGFPDARAAEDLQFFEKLSSQDHMPAWAPKAVVHWQLQPSFPSTFRKFVLYSKHNVWAGRQKDWHYGIAKTWLLLLVMLCLSVAHSSWWLIPLVTTFGARVGRRIWKHRAQFGARQIVNPFVLLGVAAVMLTIDVATFVGWIQALVTKNPQASVENSAAIPSTRNDRRK
jgi:glycosyltransferase involved in cell wall biosynthesis